MFRDLPWSELDPRRRPPVDAEAARRLALDTLRRKPGRTDSGRGLAERELQYVLWAHYGAWSWGWCDAQDDGGANRVWRGSGSVGDDDEETAGRVVAALEDWSAWLDTLADAFDGIAAATEELDEVDAIARAATELLPLVVERTKANDAWYRTFAQTMGWCVQACGRATGDVTELIEGAMSGRFASWSEPAPELAREVADDLALELAVRPRPPFTPDALEAWWVIRETALWGTPTPLDRRPAEADGHRRYIEQRDLPRGKRRASAFTRALVRARFGAERKLPLDVALLQEWQELAMESKGVALRRGEAFAKAKGERYGRPKDLERRLAKALADACADGAPAVARAARAYLDVCFLHPFADGNARAARLVLDYVLTREGLRLRDAVPVFALPRWGHDEHEPWRFQRTLALCVGTA